MTSIGPHHCSVWQTLLYQGATGARSSSEFTRSASTIPWVSHHIKRYILYIRCYWSWQREKVCDSLNYVFVSAQLARYLPDNAESMRYNRVYYDSLSVDLLSYIIEEMNVPGPKANFSTSTAILQKFHCLQQTEKTNVLHSLYNIIILNCTQEYQVWDNFSQEQGSQTIEFEFLIWHSACCNPRQQNSSFQTRWANRRFPNA